MRGLRTTLLRTHAMAQVQELTRHSLPPLPYDFGALEPHIDAQTMQIHHGKHHQAYISNLNNALNKHPELLETSLEDLLRGMNSVPEDIRTTVRNNAGGHPKYTLFRTIIAPACKSGGRVTTAQTAAAIQLTVGEVAQMQ